MSYSRENYPSIDCRGVLEGTLKILRLHKFSRRRNMEETVLNALHSILNGFFSQSMLICVNFINKVINKF